VDKEEEEEIMTVEAEEAAEVAMVALVEMTNDGSMALILETPPSHLPTKK